MKEILVLTDLSANAENAAQYAVMLSSKLNSNIFLFNTFLNAIIIPNYTGGPASVDGIIELEDESKNKLELLADKLAVSISHLPSTAYKPKIKWQLGEGSLNNNIDELARSQKPEMIIMGARTDSALEHIFIGSDTSAVIEKADCPVLVVPKIYTWKKIEKIVLATDFDEADIKAIEFLTKLGRVMEFKLEIVHVTLPGNEETSQLNEINFKDRIADFHYAPLTYKTIKGQDVINRLNRFCHETHADILTITHHKHSFFARLVLTSLTQKALSHQKIPLLVLPIK